MKWTEEAIEGTKILTPCAATIARVIYFCMPLRLAYSKRYRTVRYMYHSTFWSLQKQLRFDLLIFDRVGYNMVSLANLWLTAYGGYIGVTAGRQPKSTTKLKLRRTTMVVYLFSHSLLSVTSLDNSQGMMAKITFKDPIPVMCSRWISTANLPSLLLSLKYRFVE